MFFVKLIPAAMLEVERRSPEVADSVNNVVPVSSAEHRKDTMEHVSL